jgi:hypothetical protein
MKESGQKGAFQAEKRTQEKGKVGRQGTQGLGGKDRGYKRSQNGAGKVALSQGHNR